MKVLRKYKLATLALIPPAASCWQGQKMDPPRPHPNWNSEQTQPLLPPIERIGNLAPVAGGVFPEEWEPFENGLPSSLLVHRQSSSLTVNYGFMPNLGDEAEPLPRDGQCTAFANIGDTRDTKRTLTCIEDCMFDSGVDCAHKCTNGTCNDDNMYECVTSYTDDYKNYTGDRAEKSIDLCAPFPLTTDANLTILNQARFHSYCLDIEWMPLEHISGGSTALIKHAEQINSRSNTTIIKYTVENNKAHSTKHWGVLAECIYEESPSAKGPPQMCSSVAFFDGATIWARAIKGGEFDCHPPSEGGPPWSSFRIKGISQDELARRAKRFATEMFGSRLTQTPIPDGFLIIVKKKNPSKILRNYYEWASINIFTPVLADGTFAVSIVINISISKRPTDDIAEWRPLNEDELHTYQEKMYSVTQEIFGEGCSVKMDWSRQILSYIC